MTNPIAPMVGALTLGVAALVYLLSHVNAVLVVGVVLAALVVYALKVANQWERAVVLRAGKLRGVAGPGIFWMIPVFDMVATWIDLRTQITPFNAERTLTRDTVPVNIDAVVLWSVHDPQKAALEVVNYRTAIEWVAQTSLREMIGTTDLQTLLSDRRQADERLRAEIAVKTAPWGISVNGVEIRDVTIPDALQDAMSRQAQAQRERDARVTLGSAEVAMAHQFVEAAKIYAASPDALQLRGMTMLYEAVKERGSTIVVPSSALETMKLSGIAGVTALAGRSSGAAPSAETD
ncbi:MAG: slipin family protein [Azospirillaceae bacterium]|nr:slipin family protein [Azospirillaceae bacterium]